MARGIPVSEVFPLPRPVVNRTEALQMLLHLPIEALGESSSLLEAWTSVFLPILDRIVRKTLMRALMQRPQGELDGAGLGSFPCGLSSAPISYPWSRVVQRNGVGETVALLGYW